MSYEVMKQNLQKLVAEGKISTGLTQEQRIDFAYGNTKLENDDVTRALAQDAVSALNVEDE